MAFNQYPKVVTHYVDEFEYESVNETGNKVLVDMYDGDKKRAQSPTELLLTALSACAAVDVAEILKKKRRSFTGFRVEASGVRREEHPRAFTQITLTFIVESDNATIAEIEKSARMVVDKYCSVATTISDTVHIEVVGKVQK